MRDLSMLVNNQKAFKRVDRRVRPVRREIPIVKLVQIGAMLLGNLLPFDVGQLFAIRRLKRVSGCNRRAHKCDVFG